MPQLLTRMKKLLSHKKPIPVKRSAKRYVVEQGWHLSNSATYPEWHGQYRTRFGSFQAELFPRIQSRCYE